MAQRHLHGVEPAGCAFGREAETARLPKSIAVVGPSRLTRNSRAATWSEPRTEGRGSPGGVPPVGLLTPLG